MLNKDKLYYCWELGEQFAIGNFFMNTEFECPRSVEHKISVELVEKLDEVRKELDMPITVTSGFRSNEYNEYLKIKGYKVANKSQHLLGNAADITCRDMDKLFFLVIPTSFLFIANINM